MRRFPWIRMRKKTDPDLPFEPPLPLGSFSTGEYFHEQTPRERLIRRIILERADANARRLGMDRREFLASAMGMATSLSVLNAVNGCSTDEKVGGGGSDGGYNVPDAATVEWRFSNRAARARAASGSTSSASPAESPAEAYSQGLVNRPVVAIRAITRSASL